MTLIIAAISKNGVFIKSDKRGTVKHSSGSVQYNDDLKKVFVSSDKRTIIYNHGINIINGKSWLELAVKSANQIQQGKVSDIKKALDEVESNVSADVLIELSKNQLDDLCAFVVILKARGNKWCAGEIIWGRGQGVKKTPLGRFIWSGSGTKYLRLSNKHKEDSYWASIRLKEAKAQIDLLYAVAIKNQDSAQGHEFSPMCDDVTIT